MIIIIISSSSSNLLTRTGGAPQDALQGEGVFSWADGRCYRGQWATPGMFSGCHSGWDGQGCLAFRQAIVMGTGEGGVRLPGWARCCRACAGLRALLFDRSLGQVLSRMHGQGRCAPCPTRPPARDEDDGPSGQGFSLSGRTGRLLHGSYARHSKANRWEACGIIISVEPVPDEISNSMKPCPWLMCVTWGLRRGCSHHNLSMSVPTSFHQPPNDSRLLLGGLSHEMYADLWLGPGSGGPLKGSGEGGPGPRRSGDGRGPPRLSDAEPGPRCISCLSCLISLNHMLN